MDPTNDNETIMISERLSRRRKAKGSSIIVNSERLLHFETFVSTPVNNDKNAASQSAHPLSFYASKFKNQINKSIDVACKAQKQEHISAVIIQHWWRRNREKLTILPVEESDEIIESAVILSPKSAQAAAAMRITRWMKERKNKVFLSRFTQKHRWTVTMANKLFSQLILGPRARRLVKSDKGRSLIMVITDLKKVIAQVLTPYVDPSLEIDDQFLKKIDSSRMKISSSDLILAQGLIKQYFQSKVEFHEFIFADSVFRSLPCPGWLDLSGGVKRRFRETEIRRSPALKTQSKPQKRISANIFSGKNLNSSLQINTIDENTIDIIDYRPSSRHFLSPSSNATQSSKSASAPNPLSHSKRSGSKAHIQLDVLSADRLMPAKKGSVTRDATGGIVPDRKPCIKVSLYLPSISGAIGVNQSNMKRVYHNYFDYNVTTLNPRWGETFYIPLPCPKQIIALKSSHEDRCEELLRYWSSGTILIQIVDGERFNEEIFLGEVTLLLSSMLVPGMSKNGNERRKHVLEATGSYALNKSNAKDRVSGTLQLHAYIHLPDAQFLHDIVSQSSISSPRESPVAASSASISRAINHSSPVRSTSFYHSPLSAEQSPSPQGNQPTRRMSMIADVSKCLTNLSNLQFSADVAINKMNMKLQARRASAGPLNAIWDNSSSTAHLNSDSQAHSDLRARKLSTIAESVFTQASHEYCSASESPTDTPIDSPSDEESTVTPPFSPGDTNDSFDFPRFPIDDDARGMSSKLNTLSNTLEELDSVLQVGSDHELELSADELSIDNSDVSYDECGNRSSERVRIGSETHSSFVDTRRRKNRGKDSQSSDRSDDSVLRQHDYDDDDGGDFECKSKMSSDIKSSHYGKAPQKTIYDGKESQAKVRRASVMDLVSRVYESSALQIPRRQSHASSSRVLGGHDGTRQVFQYHHHVGVDDEEDSDIVVIKNPIKQS